MSSYEAGNFPRDFEVLLDVKKVDSREHFPKHCIWQIEVRWHMQSIVKFMSVVYCSVRKQISKHFLGIQH